MKAAFTKCSRLARSAGDKGVVAAMTVNGATVHDTSPG